MVARRNDDAHRGAALVQAHHVFRIEPHRSIGRHGSVVNVATDQQGVGLLAGDKFGQLPEEMLMLIFSVVMIEVLPYVPVGGVDEFHVYILGLQAQKYKISSKIHMYIINKSFLFILITNFLHCISKKFRILLRVNLQLSVI